MAEPDNSGLISTASKLVGLYVIYVFLSGWAFNDYYFRFFGIDPRFLDVSFYDTVLKGFVVLFTGAKWLWAVYALLLVLPIVLDSALRRWPVTRTLLLATIMVAALIPIYIVSRSAGESKARTDKGDHSSLPGITFSVQKRRYVGKLLYLKGDTYFIDRVRPLGEEGQMNLKLSVYKAADLSDVKVIEHQ